MRRPAVYSRSRSHTPVAQAMESDSEVATARRVARRQRWRSMASDTRFLWSAIGVLLVALMLIATQLAKPGARVLTQEDIDAAVLKTLETTSLPSAAARAAQTIGPSIVRVMSYEKGTNGREDLERGVGTGVVIVDKGTADGVKNGNVFTVVRAGDPYTRQYSGMADEDIGEIVIIEANKNVSSGLMVKAAREIVPGDRAEMRLAR